MKVGDMIKIDTGYVGQKRLSKTALIIRIGKRHNERRVATVMTNRGIETWPLDSHYKYEVISDALTDEQLENVVGGMPPERFSQWKAERLNEAG